MTALLTANNLSLLRGDICLFDDIDFALGSGELLLIEGPNGSGKTSLLKTIAGLLEPLTGSIAWCGRPTRSDAQLFRAALAWLSHRAGFKGELSPLENLRFESGLRVTRALDVHQVLERVGVAACARRPMGALSAGQQRRVGLARLLLSQAPLWLLDEPYTNLDSDGQALVRRLISEHLSSGGLCAVASHQPLELDAPVTRICLG